MFGFSLATFAITFLAIAVVGFVVVRVRRVGATNNARARVLEGSWIDARSMIAGWDEWREKYQDEDGPGCFIILTFDHEVTDGDYSAYQEAYVSKAAKAYEGAHELLTSGDVEELAQSLEDQDRFVYAQIRFYDTQKLNTREEDLRKILHAHDPFAAPSE